MAYSWHDVVACGRHLASCNGGLVVVQTTALLGIFKLDIKMNCWGDEINVLFDVLRNTILLTGNVSLASRHVFVLKVLSVQQALCLGDCGIEMEPA